MPIKLIVPIVIGVVVLVALDNREEIARIWKDSRQRLAMKMREIANEIHRDEDAEELEELRRGRSRSSKYRDHESTGEGSARDAETGALRRRNPHRHEEYNDWENPEKSYTIDERTQGMLAQFKRENPDSQIDCSTAYVMRVREACLAHERLQQERSRVSTETIKDEPGSVSSSQNLQPALHESQQLSSVPTRPITPVEPANPFESGYDTQHTESAVDTSAYWDVNDWVSSSSHGERTEEGSVVSTPSMAGTATGEVLREEDVLSLDGSNSMADGWSEVGSDISDESDRKRV